MILQQLELTVRISRHQCNVTFVTLLHDICHGDYIDIRPILCHNERVGINDISLCVFCNIGIVTSYMRDIGKIT